MSKYVLRWQMGLLLENRRTHYTYGSKEMLRQKAEVLAKDDKILFITIDKIDEVIKDTRSQKMAEYFEDEGVEL
ncbi:hypothetical protein BGT96_04090 [Clostridioides difficile]|uniref:hypothetical protein n=1 Tax=Clostridioides difficile TaxID=1496 RepID=UPI00093959DB|nr:hypothetical protein [Clostridioides difficile]EGT4533141.1 hypothetical protein [Clostridioides difficile]EGT4708541.1 hypothetical protein [Clostridioides difficile]EGT4838148.1 hypothetical protein [Clostridioides difficile]EGT4913996.1 hypothetical protein [Clostridioides difficile]EGT5505421.1 hypothetical protein [Clostridioides difficile]